MNREHILQFLNDNPVFFLATCHGGLPHVRTMRLLRADEHGIFFSTSRNKALHRQLKANPAVEMCFYSPGDGLQIRIAGKVGLVSDPAFRNELAGRVPAMSSFVLDDGPYGRRRLLPANRPRDHLERGRLRPSPPDRRRVVQYLDGRLRRPFQNPCRRPHGRRFPVIGH